MPNKKLNIYWLDDDTNRFADYKPLLEDSAGEFSLDATVQTIEVRANIADLILKWETKPPEPAPDLFMLDHIFSAQLPHKMNGNTLAHLLRRTFPNVPLVSVTAMYSSRQESGQDVHEYTAIFHYNKLSENIEELFSVARDFQRLKFTSWDELVKELQVPASEQNVLRMAIPQDLMTETTPTKQSQLVRWVRSMFLQYPGFLLDELHAATFLGLSVQGFQKVRHKFDSALYCGPFAIGKRPVWWQTKLRDCLYQIVGVNAPDYTQAAGRMLADFSESDLSRCYVSNTTSGTDFVVAETHPNQTWQVVRERYVKKNPNIASMPPGFDQPLIIDGQ